MDMQQTKRVSIAGLAGWLALTAGCFGQAAQSDAELVRRAKQRLGPLPKVMASDQNPITPAKVALGKMLFYETRLSADGTVACVRCHPFSLYGADGLRKSVGVAGKPALRNAPTVLNAAGQISAHWVGNRKDVEDQASQSLVGNVNPAMPSAEAAEKKLRGIAGYGPMFAKAFPGGSEPVSAANYGRAVGAFERTLVTPSPFDAFLEGNAAALTDPEKEGLKTFLGEGCAGCHSGTYVGGGMYAKFGVVEPYWKYTKSAEIDEGRFTVTKDQADKYVFKVPVLRNVAMTAPYFHDGSVDALAEAVRIMGRVQLGLALTDRQVEVILAFLNSLTGRIPPDALAVPILPRKD